MTAFLALVVKDLLLFSRDRRALVMSFLAPIVIASFFGYVFSGSRQPKDAARVVVALVDEDAGAAAKTIASKLAATAGIEARPLARDEALAQVRTGKIAVAAILPKDFGARAGRAFLRGGAGKPELEIHYDPSKSAERQMVEGVLTGIVMEAVSAEVFGGASSAPLAEEALRDLDAGATPAELREPLRAILRGVTKLPKSGGSGTPGSGGMSVPFQTKAQAVTARAGQQYDGVAHSFAGMGVQFTLFLGIEAGVALLLQRKRGLWKRFRSSPVSRFTLLGSKGASAAICAAAILIVMFLFARIVFGVRIQGSMAGFAMIVAAFSLMTAAFGLSIAALGGSAEAARPIAVLVTLVMVMLGGAWVPVFIFPAWLRDATLVMPTRWAVDALDAMTWRGLGIEAAVAPTLVLLGFTAAFAALALARFRWDAD